MAAERQLGRWRGSAASADQLECLYTGRQLDIAYAISRNGELRTIVFCTDRGLGFIVSPWRDTSILASG